MSENTNKKNNGGSLKDKMVVCDDGGLSGNSKCEERTGIWILCRGRKDNICPPTSCVTEFPCPSPSRSKAVCTTSANRWSVVCYRHVTLSGLNNNNAVKVKALSHLFPSLSLTFFNLFLFFSYLGLLTTNTHTWQLFNYAITQLRL